MPIKPGAGATFNEYDGVSRTQCRRTASAGASAGAQPFAAALALAFCSFL
jgi:hypothetical protein